MTFRKKLEKDLIKGIEDEIQEAKVRRKILIANIQRSSYKIKLNKFGMVKFHKNLFQDPTINYNCSEVSKAIGSFLKFTSESIIIAGDLAKIKDLKDNSQISDTTYYFIVERFYSANYDSILNYLKILAKIINRSKRYRIRGRNLRVKKAWQTFCCLERYDRRFHNYLRKFLDQDLRNSIAHNTVEVKNNFLIYKDEQDNTHRMKVDTLFVKITNIGFFINQVQESQTRLSLQISKKFLKNKTLKTKLEFNEFTRRERYYP